MYSSTQSLTKPNYIYNYIYYKFTNLKIQIYVIFESIKFDFKERYYSY